MSLFRSIWDDLKYSLRTGSMVLKLMIVNFAVFVMVYVVFLILWIFMGFDGGGAHYILNEALNWLCMPGRGMQLLLQPWSPITSLFLHQWPGHFLGNMVALFLFGKIVSDLVGDRRVLPIYLLGGLVGNALYFISALLFPHLISPYALGASGAIMALAGAALILAPDYRVMLFLLGEVKVKYIVLVLLLLDLVSIANNSNTGGHAAHLGGFIAGCVIAYRLPEIIDPINRLLNRIQGWILPGSRPKKMPPRQPAVRVGASPRQGAARTPELSRQERIDAILDKIKAHGVQSLSPEEEEFLRNASR